MLTKEQQIAAFLQIFETSKRLKNMWIKSGPEAAWKSISGMHSRHFPDVTHGDFMTGAKKIFEGDAEKGVRAEVKSGELLIHVPIELARILMNGNVKLWDVPRKMIKKEHRLPQTAGSKRASVWLGLLSQLTKHTGIPRAEISRRIEEKFHTRNTSEKIEAARRLLTEDIKI